jgi:stage III sporulation protein AG
MDWNTLKEKMGRYGAKYKYVLIVVLSGILLMSIPSARKEESETIIPEQKAEVGLAEKLEEILARVDGVGNVRVLLTEADSARTVYQTDEQRSPDGSLRVETVIVSDGSRGDNGLVSSVTPPTYLGALVVCQGADRPTVQLAVIQAVSNVTGISTDRITVVKMK